MGIPIIVIMIPIDWIMASILAQFFSVQRPHPTRRLNRPMITPIIAIIDINVTNIEVKAVERAATAELCSIVAIIIVGAVTIINIYML